jgi:hypothetical protein
LEGVIQHEIADAYHLHKEAFAADDVLRLVSWFSASQSLVASKVWVVVCMYIYVRVCVSV